MRTISTERLRAAATESDVVELVRDYMGDWLPEEIGQLPEQCRPGKLRDGEDLNSLSYNLTRAAISFDVEPEHLPLIEEMDHFVNQACRRVAEIQLGIPAHAVTH